MSVGVGVDVNINKRLVEYPTETFAGVLVIKRRKFSKILLLNPGLSAETEESHLAEDLLVLRY